MGDVSKIHKGNRDKKINNPTSNREAKRRNKRLQGKNKPHISTESKAAKLSTHATASAYYQLYLRHIGSQKAFQVWLSRIINSEKPNVWGFWQRIGHYFIQILRSIGGRL